MNLEGASETVLRFIDRHIETVEHLEILLLLSEQNQDWKVSEIFQKIQSSEASVLQRLQQLTAAGLLVNSGPAYRFEPREESLREVVKELAELYHERRVRVIEAIYARKSDAVQTFAEAFKFRKN